MEGHLPGQIEAHRDLRYKIAVLEEDRHINVVVLNEIVLASPTDDPGFDEAFDPFQPPAGIKDDRCHNGQRRIDDADAPKRNQPVVCFFPKYLNAIVRGVNRLPPGRVAGLRRERKKSDA
jgi:hypothetical protein